MCLPKYFGNFSSGAGFLLHEFVSPLYRCFHIKQFSGVVCVIGIVPFVKRWVT